MAIETKPWDATEVLNTPADIPAYLEDGSDEELLRALGAIVRSKGMSAHACGAAIEALHQAIEDGEKSGFGDVPFDFDGFLVRMQTKYGPQV